MRNRICPILVAAAVGSALLPAHAGEAGIGVTGGERSTARYACDDGTERVVAYINGEADSLAIVPVDGMKRIFVNVLSASGARYATGQYVWWTKGPEATLYDLTRGKDGKPLAACREAG